MEQASYKEEHGLTQHFIDKLLVKKLKYVM